jgi:hypothetical protein
MHVTILLLVLAVLNLVPGVVALVPARARALYDVVPEEPALALILRHRAVFLALVGWLLALAAFDDAWWRPALLTAVVSKTSFLLLYRLTGPHGPALRRVAFADVGALVVLGAIAVWRAR